MSEQTLLHVAEAEPTTCSDTRDNDCSRQQNSCETETTEQETHHSPHDIHAILQGLGLVQGGSYSEVSGNICLDGKQHNGLSVTLHIGQFIQIVGGTKIDPVLQTRESANIYTCADPEPIVDCKRCRAWGLVWCWQESG